MAPGALLSIDRSHEPREAVVILSGWVGETWRLGEDASINESPIGKIAGRIVGLRWLNDPKQTEVIIREQSEDAGE